MGEDHYENTFSYGVNEYENAFLYGVGWDSTVTGTHSYIGQDDYENNAFLCGVGPLRERLLYVVAPLRERILI